MSLFGGSQPQAAQQTVASGVDIQSSVYGAVIPVVYGRARLTGNLIDYDDFKAIAHTDDNAGGGKGGESSSSKSYTYSASFMFALCEGTVTDIQNVWASKSATAFANSKLGLSAGGLTQNAWGTWTTNHPTKALAYAGTAYVHAAAYDLGSSAQLPNLSYEVTGLFPNTIAGLPDADPKDVVTDALCNPRYGVGYSFLQLADLSLFSNYCRAAGLVISPVFGTQSDAASQLNAIVQSCNAEFVWSGAKLTIVPYGDTAITANGATYTPPPAPLYSLTDDDFLDIGNGEDPVQCSRTRPSDQMNSVRFEYLDRSNSYNAAIVEATNQAAIEAYGLRSEQPEQMHHFCNAAAAKLAATLKLQRQSVRNVYSFTLGWRYCLLDPMDVIEITDTALGLEQQWVRILSLEEDDNGNIKVTAEEYLGGVGHAPLYSFESGAPYEADFNIAPGNVNPPLIFEPPPLMLSALSKVAPQVMVGVSGGPNWGGCDVWLSVDNATYKRMGRITNPARQGTLTNTLAAGADPDTAHTLSVLLNDGSRALIGGAQDDADGFRTLCYADGELISYETASLTGANAYGLTYLRRGVYGSPLAAHAAGTEFCRLDDAVVSFDLPVDPVSYVGKTLYLKFLSFNVYGGGQQTLSDVIAYPYNPNGQGIFVYPPTGVSFSVGAEQQKDGAWISYGVVSWTASPDPLFDMYEVQYRLHTGPGPWISWRGGPDTTSFRISPIPADTAYDVQVRAVRTKGPFYSTWDQQLNTASVGKTTAPPAPTGLTVTGGYRQITVDWTASAENDIAWYEVWEGPDATFANASKIGQVNSDHYLRPGLNLSDTRYYWVRAQDTSGNFSTFLGPGHATTNAVDAADVTGQLITTQIADAAVTGAKMADNTIDITKIATGYGLPAYWTGAALPTSSTAPDLIFNGSVIIWSVNAKLYRYTTGSGWTVATDGSDITPASITTGAIVAGAITTALLDAGAVTASKLFVGDTTNLITDPLFVDNWGLTSPVAGVAVILTGNATVHTELNTPTAGCFFNAGIPASDTNYYNIFTPSIPINAGTRYRIRADLFSGSSNKNLYVVLYFLEADGVTYTTSQTLGPATPTAFATAGEYETQFTSPGNAAGVSVAFTVIGNNPSAAAGAGYWLIGNPRLERLTTGTLIQDGSITTNHIVVGGLDAAAITAGTITGDRMKANFIDGQRFTTVHTSGQPFIEINGQANTVTSGTNGPWFRVNDGSVDRVLIGQRFSDWGLWIYDAAGNPFFVEDSLASGVVVTDHLAPNSVSYGYSGTAASGSSVPLTFTVPAGAGGELVFSATMSISPSSGGSYGGTIQVKKNGTAVGSAPWTPASPSFMAAFAGSLTVAAGDVIIFQAVPTTAGSVTFNTGSAIALLMQR